jgi:hypothetical protein
MSDSRSIDRVLRRLETRGPLGHEDRAAVRGLPLVYKTLDPAAYIIREGEPAAPIATN